VSHLLSPRRDQTRGLLTGTALSPFGLRHGHLLHEHRCRHARRSLGRRLLLGRSDVSRGCKRTQSRRSRPLRGGLHVRRRSLRGHALPDRSSERAADHVRVSRILRSRARYRSAPLRRDRREQWFGWPSSWAALFATGLTAKRTYPSQRKRCSVRVFDDNNLEFMWAT
jgi:hypothetical protein